MANPMYGQNKFDNDLDTYSKYLDFTSGYLGNLTATGVTISEAEAVAQLAAVSSAVQADSFAATLIPNALNICDVTVAAAGDICLPEATKGVHLAMRYEQHPDGAAAEHRITCNGGALSATGTTLISGNVFAKQIIGGQLGNGSNAVAVVTAGTASAPTSNKLIFTATTGNNFLGDESILHFYCPSDGEWLVNCFFVQQGTGAAGAYTVA
jgi:hypothetical protein